jgi:excisionase family DNA binding protein
MNESEADMIMTVVEVSKFLRIGTSTVYRLAQEGDLPARKVGGKWRFYRKHLELWLQGHEDIFADTSATKTTGEKKKEQ